MTVERAGAGPGGEAPRGAPRADASCFRSGELAGDRPTSPLFTDLYEVTMAEAYLLEGMTGTAVFEVFFRRMPPSRSYVVAAGLEDVLGFLEQLRFDDGEIDYLRRLGLFRDQTLDHLGRLRFTGDVWAVPEGTLVFENEPILQVVAPIVEAQLAETYVLNQLHFQSVLASKAARVVDAAAGRAVVDFGSRRAHGTDAAVAGARASYLAGAAGTSNLLAARRHALPVFGTMAHSFIQAFGDEAAAFAAFARAFPETTLLVDTYDTLAGVDRVIALAGRLGGDFRVAAVRLDSGDLADLAARARARLDAAGLNRVRIFASSGLDEYAVSDLVARGAPIDGFGVGTRMAVSADAPDIDLVYKLVEYEGRARGKLSPGKRTHPGRKQVHRQVEAGRMRRDVLSQFGRKAVGQPLLVPVMEGGRRIPFENHGLMGARERRAEQIAQLPDELRAIRSDRSARYPVDADPELAAGTDGA